MSNLGLEARDLIRAGRSALRPNDADRERIARSLAARIGASGGLPGTPASSVVKIRGWSGPKVSALVVGLGAGALLVASRFESVETHPSPVLQSAVVTPVAAPPIAAGSPASLEPAVPPAAAARRPSVVESQVPAAKRRSDRLAEEVQILSRAQTALHAGGFASALRSLEEHARKFPRGTLAPERRAARIHALCGLGRLTEAEVELARLSPRSLHAGSAREACATGRTASSE